MRDRHPAALISHRVAWSHDSSPTAREVNLQICVRIRATHRDCKTCILQANLQQQTKELMFQGDVSFSQKSRFGKILITSIHHLILCQDGNSQAHLDTNKDKFTVREFTASQSTGVNQWQLQSSPLGCTAQTFVSHCVSARLLLHHVGSLKSARVWTKIAPGFQFCSEKPKSSCLQNDLTLTLYVNFP